MALSPLPPRTHTASHETAPERGTYICERCGFALPIEQQDELPECPNCGDTQFRSASIFAPKFARRSDLTAEHEWLDEARLALAPGSTPRLTYRDGEAVHVLPLHSPLTRIGRSPTAHVRLNDPTVSRRHAMIVFEDGKLRILDDRSLNGVYVNGERVEQAMLADGDEVVIGGVHLYVVVP